MEIFKRLTIAVICAFLLGKIFAAAFLSKGGGMVEGGGYPVSCRNDLRAFLTDQGFTRCAAPVQQAMPKDEECYRGSYEVSRPFFVKIWTQTNTPSGLYVETYSDFEGFSSRVEDSSKKAKKFSDSLFHWLMERQMEGK